MSDYNKTKKSKQLRPASKYPELVRSLARASIHAEAMHKELSHASIGKKLGISPQAFSKHVLREKNDKSKN